MRSLYVCITHLLVGLASLGSLPAHARGDTGEESALWTVETRRAPLTLSANGQWRLHVDSKSVLHRVRLADEKQAQRIALPLAVLRLAASRSGQRVALITSSACVGLVDFGDTAATVAKLVWLPGGPPIASTEPSRSSGPEMPSEDECGGVGSGNRPVAISTDGRWIATPSQVYDIDTRQVIASLPFSSGDIGGRHTLKLQFVDNNTKLLMVTATLGEGYESLSTPSDLQFAVWDLSSKALYNLISVNHATLVAPQSFFIEYSAQTGALYWVNGDRYWAAQQSLKEGDVPPPFEVMQTTLGACERKPKARFPLAAWDWVSFLVDPLGRWIAGVRKVDPSEPGAKDKQGFVEQLVVIDLDSRRQVAQQFLKEELHGLISTPDGETIYGLTPRPIDPGMGLPATSAPGPNAGGELIKIRVDLGRVSTPKEPTSTWEATPCKIEDETPSARSVEHRVRLLQPLWAVPVDDVASLRQRALDKRAEGVAAQPAEGATCTEQDLTSSSFVMQDKTLWLDRFSDIAQLDTSSGQTMKTLPTPRKENVCSVPVPMAGGFVSYQGDTLSWRPFDGRPAGATARRVIDFRQGWVVSSVTAVAKSIVAVWRTKPGTTPAKDEQAQSMDLLIAAYDAVTHRRLSERTMSADTYDMIGDESDPAYQGLFLPACHDMAGPMTSGYDWRVSHLGSFRAYACGPSAASTRTVFWSHLDISRKPALPPQESGDDPRRTWALDGTIGVAQDGALMRVFDIATRREIAQIETSSGAAMAVQLIASEGLVVIESIDNAAGMYSRNLRAYSFK